MAREGRGLICLPMEGALCDALGLSMQVSDNTSVHGTGFTVSIGPRSA
jgi:3,4-dihydroxy 2-butanone 4-phosphate synthase/GTP cyclohydrolase II